MGTILTYGAIGLLVLIAAFVWWRWTSVARGARQRDERVLKLITPLADKLLAKQEVSQHEVQEIASKPQARLALFNMLSDMGAVDLFPDEYLVVASQAEAQLAYWMMHPNELQDPPAEIALEAVVRKRLGDDDAAFHVLRFRMPEGHWAGRDWLLGLAGPFFEGDPPYLGPAGAFSRSGDKADATDPEALVDWFVDLTMRKGA